MSKLNMKEWINEIIQKKEVVAMPIMTHPGIEMLGQWLPPKMFKDWNDCLLNKPMKPVLPPNKNDRDNHLAGRRNAGVKL